MDLHLRGDLAAPGFGRLQEARVQAGGTEDHILVQPLQIVRPQPEPAAHRLQLIAQGPQRVPIFFIAGGHIDPRVQQEL